MGGADAGQPPLIARHLTRRFGARLPLAEALGGVQKTAVHSRAGEAGSGGGTTPGRSSGATACPRSRGDASARAPVHDPCHWSATPSIKSGKM